MKFHFYVSVFNQIDKFWAYSPGFSFKTSVPVAVSESEEDGGSGVWRDWVRGPVNYPVHVTFIPTPSLIQFLSIHSG